MTHVSLVKITNAPSCSTRKPRAKYLKLDLQSKCVRAMISTALYIQELQMDPTWAFTLTIKTTNLATKDLLIEVLIRECWHKPSVVHSTLHQFETFKLRKVILSLPLSHNCIREMTLETPITYRICNKAKGIEQAVIVLKTRQTQWLSNWNLLWNRRCQKLTCLI